ncbi:nuclease A inhibitor family protein [Spirosoma sp. SC4-14]|uniref:nuclease A inhibitor family protein n=1 Tax=Spirosoma sp. SC4-14 TaxID=3128900 RepID=UPI0030D294E4
MTSEDPKSSGETPEKLTQSEQINDLLTDLLYPSESDEPIDYITCYLRQVEPLTVSQIKDWQMLPPEIFVDEMPEAEFWEPVITEQDWYGDEEKARTEKFQQLKILLETELTGRQVFRVGEGELDVFLLGRQADGERAGLKTKIVQT